MNHSSSSLMASSSSSSPRTWRYRVFTSFHGPDARKTFLSHLRKQFNENGISMFDDQGIERGQTIAPELTQAIRESRISIVVLTKNYASSSWCLDELLEILKCKEEMGQIVMTVFYGVDPSHVRNQTGEFGKVFNETCARKTEEKRRMWSRALNDVGNIAGEHSLNWVNEAEMIEKIARDVSDKLNATPSSDFDGMVGLEAHLREMEYLLDLENDGVKMVAISGPAGIGKSTIARALHSLLSNRFQLTCFVDNLRESYPIGLDEYGLKLRLQDQLLSMILKQNGIRICHLGSVEERLRDQKALIILDDVNNIKQLEALANETTWFGPGSRIVITTENKELLQLHGIDNTYHVRFPSSREAIDILCRYAFRQRSLCPKKKRQRSHRYGFEELALKVTELCGKLPLGLRVLGSALRGKNEDQWEEVIRRLETILDHRDIEEVLRVGYESLHENEQSLFLHIAVFFNCSDGNLVKAMFADDNLDIKYGLKILADKSLIHVSNDGEIVMHKLLQQVGTKVVHIEKPWKRRILTDAQVIYDVLERAEGNRDVSGISFDISDIDEVSISERAFKRMPNLRFLKVYKKDKDGGNDVVHIPEEMEFPRRLRLLHWKAYPSKSLPLRFCLENLVELNMEESQLEKLWKGTQRLSNLKKLALSYSSNLKELPDLSNAAMLETLELIECESLVEIHSSIENLHKLELLDMSGCTKLQVVPSLFNLAPLAWVVMEGCLQVREFPDMSPTFRCTLLAIDTMVRESVTFRCVTILGIADTMLEELTKSVNDWSGLQRLTIYGDSANIEKIPDCIQDFHKLERLYVIGCIKLASLPELPRSLERLVAESCESLKTVSLENSGLSCSFTNCFKLGPEARRVIQKSLYACLPGRDIPAEFDHQALGNSLTVPCDSNQFRICVMVFPTQEIEEYDAELLCRVRINKACLTDYDILSELSIAQVQAEHLCMAYIDLVGQDGWLEQDNEITFEFITCQELDVLICGVQIVTEETDRRRRTIDFDEASENYTIRALALAADTMLKELPKSVKDWSGLQSLTIYGDSANMEKIPDCIKDFHKLERLYVIGCPKLASLPELPRSLKCLIVESCESLKTVSLDFDSAVTCSFTNCFKLGPEARRVLEQSLWACLPGRNIPAEFDHQALGNSLTIPSDYSQFRICVVVSPKQEIEEYDAELLCRVRINKACLTDHDITVHLRNVQVQAEHLCIFCIDLDGEDGWLEQENEITFEFITCQELDVLECGVQIITEESERRRRIEFDEASKASQDSLNTELTD